MPGVRGLTFGLPEWGYSGAARTGTGTCTCTDPIQPWELWPARSRSMRTPPVGTLVAGGHRRKEGLSGD